MPIGSKSGSHFDDSDPDSSTSLVAWRRAGPRSSGLTPGPTKPRPPALEISIASEGPDSTRIGAPTISGTEVHGNAVLNRAMACRCIVGGKMERGGG